MVKKFLTLALLIFLAGGIPFGATAKNGDGKVFYFISHGGESDPFWIDWHAAIKEACNDFDATCNTSFSGGDFAVQKEALNSAIAADPDGIATTSAQAGLWTEEVSLAKEKGIPIIFVNADDSLVDRDAYVGANLKQAGVIWASYLVDNDLVSKGDTVFMPVEVPGASYQQLETEGIASVFDPRGITYEVVGVGTDPAGVIQKMSNYLVANDTDAVIALGDLVASSVQRVFDNIGLAPGAMPVVGWGNSGETARAVEAGYVDTALWQYPYHQGYMPVVLLKMAAEGHPIGYDIFTLQLYDKSSVQPILDVYEDDDGE